jgi:hypothetical protein
MLVPRQPTQEKHMNETTLKPKIIPAADIQPTDFSETVERVDGAIRFHFTTISGPTEYDVPLDRCRTRTQILGWILHLSGKRWMTGARVAHFIRLACEARGIEVPMI